MDLFEDEGGGGGNAPEFTVSEISGAVKRVIEGEFAHVRVRGEVGRVSRPSSGHLYFDLKDDRAVIAAVSWKGQAARLTVKPEEGMEVIATGRLTTFPGQSKYQLIVEDIAPAGQGALMLMLEKRRKALAAEGLFDEARKKPIPYLPEVIGVVTSPSGAVIRDILHRLRDRFPRTVLIWPVAVQGEKCAPEVAAAIRGFNALRPGGPVPRPDLLIVARGGGSLEDLWGFNEEIVVRAAAASEIPLISAVGHETDTTLIDHAADRRAPTPTAAAEMAVPVRLDLLAWTGEQGARLSRALSQRLDQRRQRLSDLARALGRPETLLDPARQRLDLWSDRLGPALHAAATRKRAGFNGIAGRLQPSLLTGFIDRERRLLNERAGRLAPAIARLSRDATRDAARQRGELDRLAARLAEAQRRRLGALADRLAAIDRTRQTLGYTETLRRGYAVVRAEGAVVTTKAAAETAPSLEIEFADGRLPAVPGRGARAKKPGGAPPEQGDLF
ncbi:MAG: exodeoxyribonuclease VII large subunit [Rhodobacteraceae bacterium]|nr:exodeoxyribonuclease VII large subunit [Paracoccaceae bacterium]